MSIRNRFFNWRYGVKRLRQKGCQNAGVYYPDYPQEARIVKYDWSKPLVYRTKTYYFEPFLGL